MDKVGIRNLIAERLAAVESRLAAACRRSGRERSAVTLIAVTKTISVEAAAILPELGLFDLGENRPQELWRKAAALPRELHWHMIGHLQRNKVEPTLPLVRMIHSVDSVRLLQALADAAAKQIRTVDVLLEWHNGQESAKHGLTEADLPELVARASGLDHIRIHGLMTMAPLQDPERCRPVFAGLRQRCERLREQFAPPHDLRHLSMGMSNDFEVAVEEGATMIRLGSVLFEGLPK